NTAPITLPNLWKIVVVPFVEFPVLRNTPGIPDRTLVVLPDLVPTFAKLPLNRLKAFLLVAMGFVNNPIVAEYILNALLFLPAAYVAVFIACPINPIAPVIAANEPNTGTATIGISPNATTINVIGAGALAKASIIGCKTLNILNR